MSLQHLGDLHAYEQALVAVIAFGPFALLAAVVYLVRRRDLAAEAAEDEAAEGQARSAAGAGEPGQPDLPLAGQRLDEDLRDQ